MRIRTASSTDAERLAQLHHETVSYAYRDIFGADSDVPSVASLTGGWRALLSAPGTHAFIAEQEVATIGSVVLAEDDAVPSGLLLKRLHVHPDHWGGGIGSQLHDRAIEAAHARRATTLNLWVLEGNDRARQMYERRGWELRPGWVQANEPSHVVDVLYEREISAPPHRPATLGR